MIRETQTSNLSPHRSFKLGEILDEDHDSRQVLMVVVMHTWGGLDQVVRFLAAYTNNFAFRGVAGRKQVPVGTLGNRDVCAGFEVGRKETLDPNTVRFLP